MRRARVYVPVLFVLLAGCGGSPGVSDSAVTSEASTTARTSPAPSELPTEPGGGPVPEESDRPTGRGGGGGSEDERTIEVGGPTLDNTFPTNPFALPRVGGSSCVLFTNRSSDVTVTVHSVHLVNLQPPGEPGLALGAEPSEHAQCRNEPGHPGHLEGTRMVHASCSNAKLEPDAATACPVEVRSTGSVGTDYTARLILRLSATCTVLVGEPCDRLVGRATPSATHPVTVTWEDSRRYSSCLVPRDRGGAEFLPEEADGRCPVDTTTAPPSETTDGPSDEPATEGEAESEEPGSTETPAPPEADEGEGAEPVPEPSTDAVEG